MNQISNVVNKARWTGSKVGFVCCVFLLSVSTGFAQKKSPLQAMYLHQLRGDDGGSGSVSVDRFDVRGGVPLITEEGNLLAMGFRYALDRYDFRGTVADWGSVHHVNLGLASRWRVNDRWLFGNYGSVGVSSEEGADKDEGVNFNFVSIAEYEVSERFTIGPGVGIASQVDQDLSVFPIVSIKWEFNDEWTLASGPSDVAASGANVYLEYVPEELGAKWVFTAGVSYGSKTFKIDGGSATESSGEERLASAYLAASYKMESGLKLSAIAGYHFFQSYSVFDDGGSELSKESLEDAPYFGVSVGFEF